MTKGNNMKVLNLKEYKEAKEGRMDEEEYATYKSKLRWREFYTPHYLELRGRDSAILYHFPLTPTHS